MKKVAILTITNSGLNFGNRLQNYALQEALKKCGAEVETIQSAKSVKGSMALSSFRRGLKSILKNDSRRKCFNSFNKRYVRFAKAVRYENINEKSFADKYDLFVAGSDQVWNPNFHFNSSFEFAAFAPQSKRYSYAASIGVSDIKEEHKQEFIRNINGMNKISVRENDSINLVKRLTGKEAQVHIDPTMLLDKSRYFEIEEKPKAKLPDKYVLMYFLGVVTDEYRNKIQKIAQAMNLPIVEFSENKGSDFYGCGPQHFIYVLNHADYICTDSFHGSVFSILFEKQFSVFVRTDNDVPMNSRIETLIDKFELRDRLLADIYRYAENIDYEKVKSILESEREKADGYLREICS